MKHLELQEDQILTIDNKFKKQILNYQKYIYKMILSTFLTKNKIKKKLQINTSMKNKMNLEVIFQA
jgi:hypothetical protein